MFELLRMVRWPAPPCRCHWHSTGRELWECCWCGTSREDSTQPAHRQGDCWARESFTAGDLALPPERGITRRRRKRRAVA